MNEPVNKILLLLQMCTLFSNDDVYSVTTEWLYYPSELVNGVSTNTSVSLNTSLTVGK